MSNPNYSFRQFKIGERTKCELSLRQLDGTWLLLWASYRRVPRNAEEILWDRFLARRARQ